MRFVCRNLNNARLKSHIASRNEQLVAPENKMRTGRLGIFPRIFFFLNFIDIVKLNLFPLFKQHEKCRE